MIGRRESGGERVREARGEKSLRLQRREFRLWDLVSWSHWPYCLSFNDISNWKFIRMRTKNRGKAYCLREAHRIKEGGM